jgi:hypothetical protein
VLFSEHIQFPTSVEHSLQENGSLGPELRRSTASSRYITRELEVAAVMTKDVAQSLVAWLNEKIEMVEELEKRASQSP